MAGRVIRGAVLPTAPEHAAPGAAQAADRAGVVVAAGDRAGVVVGGPGVRVAGGVGQRADGVPEAFVARPAVAGDLPLAGLDRHRGLAGVASERITAGVSRAAVADLRDQLGGGDDRFGVAEQRAEQLAVGMLGERLRCGVRAA